MGLGSPLWLSPSQEARPGFTRQSSKRAASSVHALTKLSLASWYLTGQRSHMTKPTALGEGTVWGVVTRRHDAGRRPFTGQANGVKESGGLCFASCE